MKRFLFLSLLPACLLTANYSAHLEQPGYTGYFSGQLSRVYFHPSIHWPADFSDFERTMTLEDGSVWRISSFSSINDWHRNDPLTISVVPEGWFTDAYYEITNHNERNHRTIKAQLFKTPILKAEFTRQILQFDDRRQVITLTDQSRWELSSEEYTKCSNWAIGDCIITGTMKSSWNLEDKILINTNVNSYIKATLKGYLYGTVNN